MPTLMLVFVLSAGGQQAMMHMVFPTMDECENNRAQTIERMFDSKAPNGSPVVQVAAVCTEQVALKAL